MTAPVRDPFPAAPNVSAYVPSADVDQSCHYLAAKLEAEPSWAGICGPAGVGKTLLLRLVARRLGARFTPVFVPSAQLEPAELDRWILAQLGTPAGSDAKAACRALSTAGRPLLLAIDEGQHASRELVRHLESLCTAELGARGIVAWSEEPGSRPPAPLAHCPARVFVEALELAAVPGYVRANLDRAGAEPELRAVLAGHTLDRIALASGGNPRAIQRLADAELAAHAWRARRGAPLRLRSDAPRITSNAPRSARDAAGRVEAGSSGRRRSLLAAVAVAAALLAAALRLWR